MKRFKLSLILILILSAATFAQTTIYNSNGFESIGKNNIIENSDSANTDKWLVSDQSVQKIGGCVLSSTLQPATDSLRNAWCFVVSSAWTSVPLNPNCSSINNQSLGISAISGSPSIVIVINMGFDCSFAPLPQFNGVFNYYKDIKTDRYVYRKVPTSGYKDIILEFDWKCQGVANKDYGQVGYSLDKGKNWIWLTTGGTNNGQYYGQPTTKTLETINFPASCDNVGSFAVGFRFITNGDGTGTAPTFIVDNVVVKGTKITSCIPPTVSTQPAGATICEGSDYTFTISAAGDAPLNYQWMKDGVAITGATNSNYAITNSTSGNDGTYTCVVTNACPSGSITSADAILVVTAKPVVSFTNIIPEDCGLSNGSVTVNATGGSGTYTYTWNTNPVQTGQTASNLPAGDYIVTVSSPPCTVTATVNIPNSGGLSATVTVTEDHCGRNDGTATVNASGGSGTYTYTWSTNPVQTTNSVTNLAAGNYTVTVDDGVCTYVQNIEIKDIPGPSVTITKIDEECNKGGGAATAVVTSGTSPFTYKWSTVPSQSGQTVINLQPGDYSVTVTDQFNCTATATVSIINPPGPIAGFDYSPKVVGLPDGKCDLTDQSFGADFWTWKLQGVVFSEEPNATITFSEEGEFKITLIVRNSFGCLDSITKTVIVDGNFSFFIPGSFTPNNDDVNEVFLPVGNISTSDKYELRVFDRWGKQVFFSNNFNEGWDGRSNGTKAPSAIYTYFIKIKKKNSKTKTYYGSIALVR